jgi:hypothetical protein
MAQSLDQYALLGDRDFVRPVHDLVVELHNNYFSNPHVQDVLHSQGHREHTPSFFNIVTMSHPRSVAALSLQYVTMAIERAVANHAIGVSLPLDGSRPKFFSDGAPHIAAEDLREEWFQQLDTTPKIREFQKTLENAWDEFNLQYVLTCVLQVRDGPVLADGEEGQLHQHIVDACKDRMPKAYHTLDSAYYNAGRRHLSMASPLWEELNKSEFGRHFILQPDEIKAGITALWHRRG